MSRLEDNVTTLSALPSLRKNGKNWHVEKSPFRPNSSLTPYAKRLAAQKTLQTTKSKEAELRAVKREAKEEQVRKLKEKREKKLEKEKWEQLESKMHRKRVERLKRREKRNKLLKA